MPRTIGVAAALALSACVQPGAEPQDPQDPGPSPEGPPACRERSVGDPVAVFAGVRCAWELRDTDAGLVLESLDAQALPPARGRAPEVCGQRPCAFDGRHTEAGPVVVVTVTSAHSEMPGGVWLGWTEGETLGFVDLWDGGGDQVWGDETPLGPSHALAPFLCGKAVALRAMPRTNAGDSVEPPASVLAREGVYGLEAGGAKRAGDIPKACVRLELRLP